MSWALITSSGAKKFLKKLSGREAQRLGAILDGLVSNPYDGDIEKLKGGTDL